MKQKLPKCIVVLIVFFAGVVSVSAQSARDVAVELKSSWKSGSGLELTWTPNSNALQYYVYRRNGKTWDLLDSLGGTTNTYLVASATYGKVDEYRVAIKHKLYTSFFGNGYMLSGYNIPVTELGTVLVLIDSNYVVPLSVEIQEYLDWLKREGWNVKTKTVLRTESVANVKQWIKSEYLADSVGVKTALLLGRIPVPYSGNFRPDAHTEHTGAWPADLYYGTYYSNWTDNVVNNSTAARVENRNVPNDGKFDISRLNTSTTPATAIQYVQLPVGRVDFSNMGSFGNDTLLMKRYLRKNLNFRSGKFKAANRALIDDNFGYFNSEAFASGGFRMFSTCVGDSIYDSRDYRTYMKGESYLLSYGCGAGTYTSASGVASSADFVSDSLLNPFTLSFGSYYGDWDNADNFLRAPLASRGWGLASVWSGRPYWVMHEAGLGKPLYRAVYSSQNSYNMYNTASSFSGVHVALMGDPTLKYFYVPVSEKFSATSSCQGKLRIDLKWETLNVDSIILWENTAAGWQKITTVAGSDTSYSVSSPGIGKHIYALQALKLMQSPSGTWWDLGAKTESSTYLNALPIADLNKKSVEICVRGVSQINDIGSGSVKWQWIGSNGTADSVTSIFNFGVDVAGDYGFKLKVYSDSGCTAMDSVVFHVKPLPTPNISAVVDACEGGDIAVEVANIAANAHKNWYKDYVLAGDTGKGITWVKPTAGVHHINVVVVDEFGCMGYDTVNYVIYPIPVKPVFTVERDARFRGDTIAIKARATMGNIEWKSYPMSGVLEKNDSMITIEIPTGSGAYNLVIAASAKTAYCESDTAAWVKDFITNGVKNIQLAGGILKNLGNQGYQLSVPTSMLASQPANLLMFDANGREISQVIHKEITQVTSAYATWNIETTGLSSGVYQLQLIVKGSGLTYSQSLLVK